MEYSNEILLEMLNISIGSMVENELCTYCSMHGCKNCYYEQDCETGIFEGLKAKAEKNLGL